MFGLLILGSAGCVERETIDWANYQMDSPTQAVNKNLAADPKASSTSSAASPSVQLPLGGFGSGSMPFQLPAGGLGSGANGFRFPAGGVGSGAMPSFPPGSFPAGANGSGALPMNFPAGAFGTGS